MADILERVELQRVGGAQALSAPREIPVSGHISTVGWAFTTRS